MTTDISGILIDTHHWSFHGFDPPVTINLFAHFIGRFEQSKISDKNGVDRESRWEIEKERLET